jgi:hypothetical protein
MDTSEVIEQLQAEKHRIDAAIKLLSGSDTTATAPIKPPKATGRRKKMSAAGRKRISEAMPTRATLLRINLQHAPVVP